MTVVCLISPVGYISDRVCDANVKISTKGNELKHDVPVHRENVVTGFKDNVYTKFIREHVDVMKDSGCNVCA